MFFWFDMNLGLVQEDTLLFFFLLLSRAIGERCACNEPNWWRQFSFNRRERKKKLIATIETTNEKLQWFCLKMSNKITLKSISSLCFKLCNEITLLIAIQWSIYIFFNKHYLNYTKTSELICPLLALRKTFLFQTLK